MRCRCCNVSMNWREFSMLQDDGKEEDMCSKCLGIAYSPEFCDTHTYQFEAECEQFYIPETYNE